MELEQLLQSLCDYYLISADDFDKKYKFPKSIEYTEDLIDYIEQSLQQIADKIEQGNKIGVRC